MSSDVLTARRVASLVRYARDILGMWDRRELVPRVDDVVIFEQLRDLLRAMGEE